jgi:hypothetical protein
MQRSCDRDRIHQWRAQAVVGLEAELFEPAAHFTHARRIETLLDDRGHEGRKLRFAPALIGGQLGVHEIQAVERMAGILDAAEHMYAAALAGVALNGGLRINHRKFVAILKHADLVLADNRDHREGCSLRLPALGTAARVVMRRLRFDRDLDWILRALAGECPALKARRRFLEAVVNRGMK